MSVPSDTSTPETTANWVQNFARVERPRRVTEKMPGWRTRAPSGALSGAPAGSRAGAARRGGALRSAPQCGQNTP